MAYLRRLLPPYQLVRYLRDVGLEFILRDLDGIFQTVPASHIPFLTSFNKVDDAFRELAKTIESGVLTTCNGRDKDEDAEFFSDVLQVWYDDGATVMPPPIFLLWVSFRWANFAFFQPLKEAYATVIKKTFMGMDVNDLYHAAKSHHAPYGESDDIGREWKAFSDESA